MKNCGHLIHDEIGTKQYMEQLRELVKTTNHEKVKAKVLELIQAWAYAFRNSPKYRAVQVRSLEELMHFKSIIIILYMCLQIEINIDGRKECIISLLNYHIYEQRIQF